jgi:hypothetical protein
MVKKQITVGTFYTDRTNPDDPVEIDVDLDFEFDLTDINTYINGSHKVQTQAMYNFLSRNIDDGSREMFQKCFVEDKVVNGVKVGEVASLIVEEFAGKTRATIKKRSK